MNTDTNREPTVDEAQGMAWWNRLSEIERKRWLDLAGSAVVADAWAYFKRVTEQAGDVI